MIRVLIEQQCNKQCASKFRSSAVITLNSQPGISIASLTRIARITAYNNSADSIDALCFYFKYRPAERLTFREDKIQ